MKKDREAEEEVLFYMPKSLKAELKIISARENKSIKEILNEQTSEFVKAHKDGNEQHLITSSMENEDFVGFPSMAIDYRKKKSYSSKYLQKDGRLNDMGKQMWGHVSQWQAILEKF